MEFVNRMRNLAGLQEAAPAPVVQEENTKQIDSIEIDRFDGSGDFEVAHATAQTAAKLVSQILKSKAYKKWISESKSNYDYDGKSYDAAVSAAEDLVNKIDAVYNDLSSLG